MNLTPKARCIALAGLNLAAAAQATLVGDFTYIGYEIEFYGGIQSGNGEVKALNLEYSDITTTATDFSGTFRQFWVARAVENYFTSEAEVRCINDYYTDFGADPASGGGSLSADANLVLSITPDAEPDYVIPFHFNTTTNVALQLEGTSSNYYEGINTGLLIRKGSGLNNGAINGTYIRYTMGNTFFGEAPNGQGWGLQEQLSLETATLQFDGSGSFSRTATNRSIDRAFDEQSVSIGGDNTVQTTCSLSPLTDEPYQDTAAYTLQSDGTLLLDEFSLPTTTNQLSPDGNLAVSVLSIFDPTPLFEPVHRNYFSILIKQPQNMPTNAVNAVYFLANLSEQFQTTDSPTNANNNAIELERIYAFLKADGTFSLRADTWEVENQLDNELSDNDPGPTENLVALNRFETDAAERTIQLSSGTYTIAPDGMLTLHFADDDVARAQLSENAEYLVLGDIENEAGEAERWMAVGLRRTPPPAPPSPLVFNADISMTPTGLVMTATAPTNYPFEGISTENLTEGPWYSGGIFSTPSGTLNLHDPDAADDDIRFYGATFAPW